MWFQSLRTAAQGDTPGSERATKHSSIFVCGQEWIMMSLCAPNINGAVNCTPRVLCMTQHTILYWRA